MGHFAGWSICQVSFFLDENFMNFLFCSSGKLPEEQEKSSLLVSGWIFVDQSLSKSHSWAYYTNPVAVSFWDVCAHALTHMGVFIELVIKPKSPYTEGLALPPGYTPPPIPFDV